jgi:UDP-glucose 4-epimerase
MTSAEELDRQFAGKRVVVTGGLGFIGATLGHRLARAGADVVLVDSLVPEYGGNLFNVEGLEGEVTVNISDVRDPYSMRYLVKDRDYLFNLAGQTSHMDSMTDPHTDLEINCRAQLSILEACRAANPQIQLVFASTRQIYGRPDYLPVDERHPLRPVDVNGINKLAGERYHILYSDVYGIRACALRLTNTYGPRMRIKDARQTFLGIWVRLLLEGKPFEVWEGQQLRDFTFVDDAVTALMMAAVDSSAKGRIFNLGGVEVISLADLAALLVEINEGGTYTSRSFPAERKRIDIGDYYSDAKLIAESIGWKATTPLRAGLARTLAYYREHLAKYV